ncbi:endonuclease III [Aquisphaera insulae]|uniref:endonuclease III n=1 Tax=Aquisphaera insulae TaxID=2712864 RepID=UPI0013EC4353|nr:endonuclease III [Aquisphaera insulae]
MPSWTASYPNLIAILRDHYGPPPLNQGGEDRTRFEAALAVILGAKSNSSRRSPAIAAMERAGLLDPAILGDISATEIRDGVAATGAAMTPAEALQVHRLAGWFAARFPDESGVVDEEAAPTSELRDELRAIKGIGAATADSILLAIGRPSYPVDRATFRILVRHGWAETATEYDEALAPILAVAGQSPAELAALSDGMARIGRDFCGPKSPKCGRCPLECLLPDGGPLEPDS